MYVVVAVVAAWGSCVGVGAGIAPSAAVYDGDPSHAWNRVFAAFYVRELEAVYSVEGQEDVRVIGLGAGLDPAVGVHPRFLLDEPAFGRCARVLDEFIEWRAWEDVDDPVRRAVMQRDLWGVFDALQADVRRASHGMMLESAPELREEQSRRRDALSAKIAVIMRELSLSAEEIRELPVTRAEEAAELIEGGGHGSEPGWRGLMSVLSDRAGPWIEMMPNEEYPLTHTVQTDGRSVFRVFYVLPGGTKARAEFGRQFADWAEARRFEQIARLAASSQPVERLKKGPPSPGPEFLLPAGTRFVLARQMMCLDRECNPVVTGIVEGVQMRLTRPNKVLEGGFSQTFVDYALDRGGLFVGRGGLGEVEAGRGLLQCFTALGRLHTDSKGRAPGAMEGSVGCMNCHSGRTVMNTNRIETATMSLHSASRPAGPGTRSMEERTIEFKRGREDFRRLREMWGTGR